MAVKHNVQLIMYGENGEVEYGGDMKNAFRPTRDIQDHDKHYFSGLPPEFWTEHGVSLVDLYPFMPPKYEDIKRNNTEIHFLGTTTFGIPREFLLLQGTHRLYTKHRKIRGTYSKYASLDDQIDGFHYYLAYIKFGIGRTTSDAAHEIRDGKITREEGIALVKRYDHEFPRKYYKEFLEFCSITDEEIHEVIDSWRSDHIWCQENGEWKLRHAVWHDNQ